MNVTKPQLRAARALLGISQMDLARLATCSNVTVSALEWHGYVHPISLERIVRTLNAQGIRFIKDGVKLAA